MDLRLRSSVYSLPAMPTEVLAVITSYLAWSSTMRLLRASNKSLLYKLRRGGVQMMQMGFGRITGDYSNSGADGALVPWLVVEAADWRDPNRSAALKLPPMKYFSALQWCFCDFDLTMPQVENLPRTLTHLDVMNLHGLSKYEGTLDLLFPNLRHLSLRSNCFYDTDSVKRHIRHLPPGLISLRLALLADIPTLVQHLSRLPSGLIQLEIGNYATSNGHELLGLLTSQELPRSLTRLNLPKLPLFMWDSTMFDPMALQGSRLLWISLSTLGTTYISALPRALTRLHLEEVSSNVMHPRNWKSWPTGLHTLGIARYTAESRDDEKLEIPSLPTLTSLKFQAERAAHPLQEHQVHKLFQHMNQSPKLVLFEACAATCSEWLLEQFPPSLTHVILFDVLLTGNSLPPTLEALDTLDEARKHFWRAPKRFQLVLRAVDAPRSNRPLLHMPRDIALTSLTLPHHGLQDMSALPRTLTKLGHVILNNEKLEFLPPNLTFLHAYQEPYESLDLTKLLHCLPKLKVLESGTSSIKNMARAEIQLSPAHLPPEILLSEHNNTESDPFAQPITFPRDAIDHFCKTVTAGIELRGVDFVPAFLLADSTRLCLRHLIVVGTLPLPLRMVQEGIAIGLETLDLSQGALTPQPSGKLHSGSWPPPAPLLTASLLPPAPALRTLVLSGLTARRILCSDHKSSTSENDPPPFFYPNLQTLALVFDEEPPYKWNISRRLPESLQTLEVRIKSKASLDYAEPGNLSLLGFYAMSRVEKLPYHCLIIERGEEPQPEEPTLCAFM